LILIEEKKLERNKEKPKTYNNLVDYIIEERIFIFLRVSIHPTNVFNLIKSSKKNKSKLKELGKTISISFKND
jgi:hypothetical protein